jgi:hypothetical protein
MSPLLAGPVQAVARPSEVYERWQTMASAEGQCPDHGCDGGVEPGANHQDHKLRPLARQLIQASLTAAAASSRVGPTPFGLSGPPG